MSDTFTHPFAPSSNNFSNGTAEVSSESPFVGFRVARLTAASQCGDVDANGSVNVSDVVFLINFVFGTGPAPSPMSVGDVDCNGSVNVSDVVYLINFVFGSGFDPCDPDGDGVPDC
jgi:hypothetical protein